MPYFSQNVQKTQKNVSLWRCYALHARLQCVMATMFLEYAGLYLRNGLVNLGDRHLVLLLNASRIKLYSRQCDWQHGQPIGIRRVQVGIASGLLCCCCCNASPPRVLKPVRNYGIVLNLTKHIGLPGNTVDLPIKLTFYGKTAKVRGILQTCFGEAVFLFSYTLASVSVANRRSCKCYVSFKSVKSALSYEGQLGCFASCTVA